MTEHGPSHHYEDDNGSETNLALLDELARQARRLNAGIKGITFRYDLMAGGLVHEDGLLDAADILSSNQSLEAMSREEAQERSADIIGKYREHASGQATIAYIALDKHFHTTGLPDETVHAGITCTSAAWHETEYMTSEDETISIAVTTLRWALLYKEAEMFSITRLEDTPDRYTTSMLLADGRPLFVWEYDARGWESGLRLPEYANFVEIADLTHALKDLGD